MTKMVRWDARAQSREMTLYSGRRQPFTCCGATYRKRTKSNDYWMKNSHGIFIVLGQVGVEGEHDIQAPVIDIYGVPRLGTGGGHVIKHVVTRAGILTVSVKKDDRVSGNLV